MINYLLGILLIGILCTKVHSRELSNTELYYRCFSQISQQYPIYNNPLTKKVRENKISPIEACLKVFNSANFNKESNSSMYYEHSESSEVSEKISLNIINTFHQLHTTWFSKKLFHQTGDTISINESTRRLYDTSEPALYLLEALFTQNGDITRIFTHNKHLTAYRDNNNPDVSRHWGKTYYPKTTSIFKDSKYFKFSSIGRIKGITREVNNEWTYNYTNGTSGPLVTNITENKNIFPYKHFGGGFIGSPSYFHLSYEQSIPFKSNGVEKTQRRWAKNIYHDLLCRELPVIRKVDALPYTYTNKQSKHEFRYNKNCVQCHASMDTLSYLVRNIEHFQIALENNTVPRLGHISYQKKEFLGSSDQSLRTPASEKNMRLPPENIENFSELKPDGYLYYRDYKGKLIDIKVSSLSDLGNQATTLDDPYICIAKRYYKYFTGIDINIGDPEPLDLNKTDNIHRDEVIKLGLDLKNHKKPKKLIEAILRSNHYKQSDFAFKGITE